MLSQGAQSNALAFGRRPSGVDGSDRSCDIVVEGGALTVRESSGGFGVGEGAFSSGLGQGGAQVLVGGGPELLFEVPPVQR